MDAIELLKVSKGLKRLEQELQQLAKRRHAEKAVMVKNRATKSQVIGLRNELTEELEKVKGWEDWLNKSRSDLVEKRQEALVKYQHVPIVKWEIERLLEEVNFFIQGLRLIERGHINVIQMLNSWLDMR